MGSILAIETATKVCSVAIARDGEILAESSLNVPQVHVERLVISINDLLAGIHRTYRDLDAVAVSNGPGSFTGLRIGLSVAKGIAFGQDKRLIAVPTLDALAHKFADFPDEITVVPLLHARAEEFYYAAYRKTSGGLRKIVGYAIADASKIADEFNDDTIFTGEGVEAFSGHDEVKKKFESDSMNSTLASAVDVAVLAEEKFNKGEFADVRSLAPLYIQDFIAIKGNPLKKLVEKS